jgi:phenylacetate-coenzyme A ligase PaaK-like adenylate-forming protein
MTPALVDLVRTALERPSPFYRERLHAAGIHDAAALDAAAWQRVRATTHADLVADQLAHPPHGSRRLVDAEPPVRAGSTGSGDSLLVLTWSKADLARERAAGVRTLRALGLEPRQRVANALPGALATPGSLLFGDVVDDLGALDVPLGAVRDPGSAKAAWKLIDRVEASVIVVDDMAAANLFAAVPPAERPWWRGVVTLASDTASLARPEQVPANLGFTGWQRYWLAVPDAASFVGASCGAGAIHLDEGIACEIAGGNDELVEHGATGQVLLTPLGREQVLLRYRSAVCARAVDCACGDPAPAIELA